MIRADKKLLQDTLKGYSILNIRCCLVSYLGHNYFSSAGGEGYSQYILNPTNRVMKIQGKMSDWSLITGFYWRQSE